ncbi:hypothetical protein K4F85_05685 [Phaeobacter inhibens]|nr:hypothetical protein [Phaeobacter inhibens]UWR42368.1 hypothetical protein K4F85_05685 [Phaeobacter inhibens]
MYSAIEILHPAGTAGQRPTRPHGRALHAHPGTGAALRVTLQMDEV